VMNCITCHTNHDENYCPNCGERNGVKRITFISMMSDVISSVTNMDKGFLFNLKNLILKPQKITADYIQGKRKGVLNPVSYLIFSVTIYLIVINVFRVSVEPNEISDKPKPRIGEIAYQVGWFLREYLKYFWILVIIPLATALKLVYKKYNFLEHLAISAFVIGQATLMGVVSYLLLKWPLIFDPFVYFFIVWLIYKIFRINDDKIKSLFLPFLILILFLIQLIVITVLVGVIKAYNVS